MQHSKKILKIRNKHFIERLILYLLTFFIVFFFESQQLRNTRTLAFFGTKYRSMTSLNCHILKNFGTDFTDILMKDVELMWNKVLNTDSFASISAAVYELSRKSESGEGRIYPLPPPRQLGACYITAFHLDQSFNIIEK